VILSVSGLSKSFGAIRVADNICFDVAEGEAVGILGPNGAGKTSLFNLLTGNLQPNDGKITFRGEDITRTTAAKRCRSGIARSFQVPQPFIGMTVFENCLVAATHAAGVKGKSAEKLAVDMLEQTSLIDKANVQAGKLTLLDRKRLEMARALSAKPSLLLLDEIAGGLTDAECSELIESIKAVQSEGTTIIWIEHVVHALLAVVQRLLVIDYGKVIATGNPQTVINSEAVKQVYLGVE